MSVVAPRFNARACALLHAASHVDNTKSEQRRTCCPIFLGLPRFRRRLLFRSPRTIPLTCDAGAFERRADRLARGSAVSCRSTAARTWGASSTSGFMIAGGEAGSRWHEGGCQLHEVRDLRARERQSDRHLSRREDRGSPDQNGPLRRSPWQSVAIASHSEASVGEQHASGEIAERPATLALTPSCARSSGG